MLVAVFESRTVLQHQGLKVLLEHDILNADHGDLEQVSISRVCRMDVNLLYFSQHLSPAAMCSPEILTFLELRFSLTNDSLKYAYAAL